MKIFLIIFGAVILIPIAVVFLALLFFSFVKLKLSVGYNEKDSFILGFSALKFRFDILPKKKKADSGEKPAVKTETKNEKPVKKPGKNGVKSFFTDKINSLGLPDFIEILRILYNKFIKKLYFENIRVICSVATPDASDTAVLYGALNSAVFPITGFASAAKKIKDAEIHINADFSADKTKLDTLWVICGRGYTVLSLAFSLLIYILKK